jgi:hypothetical protein
VAWLWRELALVVSMLCGVRGARRGRALKVNFFFFFEMAQGEFLMVASGGRVVASENSGGAFGGR